MADNRFRTKISRYSQDGFWVIRDEKEFFISFKDYPALGKVDFSQLTFFTENQEGQLDWENLGLKVSLPLI